MNDFLQSLRNGQAEKPRTPKTRKNVDNSYQYNSNPRFNSYGGGGYPNPRNHQMKRPPSQVMPHQVGNQMPIEDASMTLLADILDNLSCHVETLVKNQEYMVNVQERTADILERQAIAIERIVCHLNLSPDMETQVEVDMETQVEDMDAQPPFENHYVTSRKPEEPSLEDDNLGNTWEAPVNTPVIKETNKIQVKSPVKKTTPPKPVLRKRRKIVERETVEPIEEPVTPVSSDAKLMPRDAIMDIIQSMREEGATFDQIAKRLVDLGQPTFSGRGEWHAQTIHRLCSKK
ncbi:MAG: hypothetical protein KKC20_01335 [Proteobacteria bacterium]|nr:hypothetical protein [Pseudomonadota bacterium]